MQAEDASEVALLKLQHARLHQRRANLQAQQHPEVGVEAVPGVHLEVGVGAEGGADCTQMMWTMKVPAAATAMLLS